MNPPPLPPPLPETRDPWPRWAAWASIIAPVLVVIIATIVGVSTPGREGAVAAGRVGTLIGIPLILLGFAGAIAALGCIPKQGTRGLLGPGLIGLALNGGLVLLMVSAVGWAVFQRSQQRQVNEDLRASSQKYQDDLRNSYDPSLGITNARGSQLNELGSQFQKASEKLRGDDAAMMKAVGVFLSDMQPALTRYEGTVQALRDTKVLDTTGLTNRAQCAARREIVQTFLDANAELKELVVNAEKRLRAELGKVTDDTSKIDEAIRGYRAKAIPRNKLIVQIRDCDQRVGDATLGVLNILESEWGNWHARGNQIEFQHTLISDEYNGFLREISAASSEQVSLQGRLVKLGQ